VARQRLGRTHPCAARDEERDELGSEGVEVEDTVAGVLAGDPCGLQVRLEPVVSKYWAAGFGAAKRRFPGI
jgi:hypothetical protein